MLKGQLLFYFFIIFIYLAFAWAFCPKLTVGSKNDNLYIVTKREFNEYSIFFGLDNNCRNASLAKDSCNQDKDGLLSILFVSEY